MTPEELKARTKAFALWILKLVDTMPRSLSGQVIGRQLLLSATSVGANYRAACRAQSRAEFAAKLSIVVEEADESLYWLELLEESGLFKAERLIDLRREAHELLSIAIASRKTSKQTDADKRNHPPVSIINRKSAIVRRRRKFHERITSGLTIRPNHHAQSAIFALFSSFVTHHFFRLGSRTERCLK